MKLDQEEPEKAAANRLKRNEAAKKCREKKRAAETPEQAAERRFNERAYRRQRYQIILAQETPEQAAARRLRKCKTRNKSRKKTLAKETPEQAAARRLKYNEKRAKQSRVPKYQTLDREMGKVQTQATAEDETVSFPIVKYEVNNDEFDESWSSFKGSEGCGSLSTNEESTRTTATESKQIQHYSAARSESFATSIVQTIIVKEEIDL